MYPCNSWVVIDNIDLFVISFSLPKEVKRHIKSLKKLQSEMLEIESKLYAEIHELKCKFSTQYVSLVTKVLSKWLLTIYV